MDYESVSEALRAQMRNIDARGLPLNPLPRIEDVWSALDGDGPMALLVTLDYIQARQELMDDRVLIPA